MRGRGPCQAASAVVGLVILGLVVQFATKLLATAPDWMHWI